LNIEGDIIFIDDGKEGYAKHDQMISSEEHAPCNPNSINPENPGL
jgi:hypothetical protein